MDNSFLPLNLMQEMEDMLQRHRFIQAFPRRRLRIRDKGEPIKQAHYERIMVDGDVLGYVPNDDNRVGVYIGAHPLTPDHNYFEIEILDTGLIGAIAVGLVPSHYPLDRQPGWNSESVGYHADDGKLFKANGFGRAFGPKNYIGDKVGCGIMFDKEEEEEGHKQTAKVFFTRNGKEIGKVVVPVPADGLFPAIGMHSEGEEVRLHLDAEWQCEDVILMAVDNCEEEWSRLHDVKLNGSVSILEYTGRGKSIIDVGLAQARFPLDTTYHYFEIEIVDPGENCYIAIGLARRDYPKHRHPGWNRGSIAYHADDGKIFVGSGVGDPFGPRCHKGDIMGCGILFPRDYNSDVDSDGSSAASPDYPNVEELLLEDYHTSDSDDDEYWGEGNWAKPVAEYGAKVKIFFTRNGKTIGQKEIRMPKGGFYPTVGMLSSDEKVRVDLRPLTG